MREFTEEQKEARRQAVRRYREKHTEQLRAYSKNYEATKRRRNKELTNKTAAILRLKKKMIVLEKYGTTCSCCGESNYKFLSIDHVGGGGNEHRKTIGGGGIVLYKWLIKNNFPSGYQVLCFNCNMAKGIYGVCPHVG